MEDDGIVSLFWARDERALSETHRQYGGYCHALARRMLGNAADADECVNGALLAAWNSIPPNRPGRLQTYLAKITRRLCLDALRRRGAQKRGGGEFPLALEEMGECLPAPDSTEQTVALRQLQESLERFVCGLPAEERKMFLIRYWYFLPSREVARRCACSESKAVSCLFRIRQKLKKHLIEEEML